MWKMAVPELVIVVDPFVDVFPVSNRHLRHLKLRKMWAINVDIIQWEQNIVPI